MKKRLFALALLLTGLAACSSDEEVVKVNTDYAEPGTAVIATSFHSIKAPKTKADADRTAAFDDEKKIESIAFFVQVGGNTNLQLFQSTKTPGTVDGLLEQVKETSAGVPGSYTAKFKMKMDGDEKAVMVAVANYAENGLDLSTITTRGELVQAVTNALTDKNPEKPLLMLGSVEKDLKEGEATAVEFKMDRLVARVDVINEAYNADAAKGFRLASAQVLNAKAQSALLPDMTLDIDVVEATAEKRSVAEKTENGLTYQRLDTLYMYENANTANATAIQINGTFNGTPVAQRVEFLKEDPTTGEKTQLAIGRNNLYTIKIRPSQDSTEVSFDIQVEDWTNAVGDTMTIEPKKEVPVLSNFTEDVQIAGAIRTDKRIEITDLNAFTGTLSFTAEGNQDSEFAIQYVGRSGAAWLSDGVVTKGDLEGFTKATPVLKRKYTIDFSQADLEELKSHSKVPSDVLILIQNANAATICDTIRVCFRPDYSDQIAGVKPVLMRDKNTGKEYFWAPVNVGATKVATKIDAADLDGVFEQCGYYFQWGRKTGLKLPSASAMDTANVANVGWPTGKDALADFEANANWKDKFIIAGTTASYGRNTQGNWLLFEEGQDNPTGANMDANAWYQKLWNANEVAGSTTTPVKTDYDPCPVGWRVPTMDEWEAIGAGNTAIEKLWDSANKIMTIPGAEKDNDLILLAAGYRYSASGGSLTVGAYGYYWSSSVPSGSSSALFVYFSSATLITNTYGRGNGFPVRCVQE